MMTRKSKNNKSVLGTVFEGLKIYFYNLDIFTKYLSFPVLGTIISIFFLFWVNYLYITNLEKLQEVSPIFENAAVILTVLLILLIPGFLVFMKAFVDYLIAFGALNSMCVIGTKRIEDVYYHKETVKCRFFPYCVLLILLSLIFGILSFPLLLPILIVALVFLSLTVQIFVLDENSTPSSAIQKSIDFVKSDFWFVFLVLVMMSIISYGIFPYLINWAVSKTPVFGIIAAPVERYINLLPIKEINQMLAETGINYTFDAVLIAENIVNVAISTIVIMYMLPFRCACCVEMYKKISENRFYKNEQKDSEETEKRGRKKKKESR